MESCILYLTGYMMQLRVHNHAGTVSFIFPVHFNPSVQLTTHEGTHTRMPAGMVVLLLGYIQLIPLNSSVSPQSALICSSCNIPKFISRLHRCKSLYDKSGVTQYSGKKKQVRSLSKSFRF